MFVSVALLPPSIVLGREDTMTVGVGLRCIGSVGWSGAARRWGETRASKIAAKGVGGATLMAREGSIDPWKDVEQEQGTGRMRILGGVDGYRRKDVQ